MSPTNPPCPPLTHTVPTNPPCPPLTHHVSHSCAVASRYRWRGTQRCGTSLDPSHVRYPFLLYYTTVITYLTWLNLLTYLLNIFDYRNRPPCMFTPVCVYIYICMYVFISGDIYVYKRKKKNIEKIAIKKLTRFELWNCVSEKLQKNYNEKEHWFDSR